MKFINRFTYHTLIQIKNSSAAQKIYADVGCTRLVMYMLNFFFRKGYIFGYMYLTAYTVRVFLKYYKDKGILTSISFRLAKPTFTFKSLKYLNSLYLFNYLYLFSTSKGFLTLEEIFNNNVNVGGILYFYITL